VCVVYTLAIARKAIMELRTSLLNKREIVTTLSGEVPILFFKNSTKTYLRDVQDHIALLLQKLEVCIALPSTRFRDASKIRNSRAASRSVGHD
jgi:Mg2+ and Co2+ transporter CorA